MAKTEDRRPHFKALLGDLFDDALENDPFPLRVDVGLWERNRLGFITSTTYSSTTDDTRQACTLSRLWDVGGISQTKANGKVAFLLGDFLCPEILDPITSPIDFVATPWTSSPVYLTYQRALVEKNTDVRFTVMAWKPDGSPAGLVSFTWRCLLGYAEGLGVEAR